MADTERSLSTILGLLSDNATGDISAQDLRDAVVSILPTYGKLYVSTAAATSMTLQDTFYEGAGTTTLGAVVRDYDMPANGRLRYTGAPTREAVVICSVSMTSNANSQTIDFKLAKNGVVDDSTEIERKIGTGSDIGSATIVGMFSLAQNDYVSLFMSNETSAGKTITLNHLTMVSYGFIE